MLDTQKEIQHEEEVLRNKSLKEDEIRKLVVEKYDLDELDHAELISNLVKDRLEDQKNFGELVGQKRKWRTEAEATKEELKKISEAPKPAVDPTEFMKQAEAKIRQEFEERDLRSLDLPDTLKDEMKVYAKNLNKTVLEIAGDPYFKAKAEEYKSAKRAEEAALSNNNKANPTKYTPENLSSDGIDFSTEEGRKKWDERVEAAKKAK